MGYKNKSAKNGRIHVQKSVFDSRKFGIIPNYANRTEPKKVEQKTILITKENTKISHKLIRFKPNDMDEYFQKEEGGILFIMRNYLWTNLSNKKRVEEIIKNEMEKTNKGT